MNALNFKVLTPAHKKAINLNALSPSDKKAIRIIVNKIEDMDGKVGGTLIEHFGRYPAVLHCLINMGMIIHPVGKLYSFSSELSKATLIDLCK